MSDNPRNESESLKAARNAPPLPQNWKHGSGGRMMGSTLPLLLSVGGTVAAGLVAQAAYHRREREPSSSHVHGLRDRAEHWFDSARHAAGDWAGSRGDSLLSAGAKAAGVTGLLKTIGSGKLTHSAALAAKAMAAKKVAQYAASGTKQAGHFVKRHPGLTASGTAAAIKARSLAQEGSHRARDAYHVLRHGRKSVQEHSTMVPGAATGMALLGIGAAAMYLFHPELGQHRRRMLREQILGTGHRFADQASHFYHSGAHLARQTGERARDMGEQARTAAQGATGGSTSQGNTGTE